MRRFEAKELYAGSDITRRFTYKKSASWDKCALFQESDCFGCCSPQKLTA